MGVTDHIGGKLLALFDRFFSTICKMVIVCTRNESLIIADFCLFCKALE
jgi:hypothetical protein